MTDESHDATPRIRYGPINWLDSSVRVTIETAVSTHLRRDWKIRAEKDLSEFACHSAAVLSDGDVGVFVKLSRAPTAANQFEVELAGLRLLSDAAGVLIPEALGVVQTDVGTALILRALEPVDRAPKRWRDIGATLARIHRVRGPAFGYERDGFWGPLHQDNAKKGDCTAFFRDRRLLPLLHTAVESGHLPSPQVRRVERLADRLKDLIGPEVQPVLLHGDAQQNNFISALDGTYVIDPAVYYGHPEWDLALVDSWQPVPDDVFDGYRAELSIAAGFEERRHLWRVPMYLAAVAIEGPQHLSKLTGALDFYE